MRKRCLGLLLLLLLCPFYIPGYTYEALAVSPDTYINQIKIDGSITPLNPPAFINSGRTMVPVVFMAVNQSIGAQVAWDGQLRKVSINCREHRIELTIGQKTALVDGQRCTMDVAPLIWQNRTYIPLSFVAAHLGGKVQWNGVNREISINLHYQPRVFAYYYYSPMEEVKANSHLFTDIAFRWLAADGSGNLSNEYKDEYREKIDWVRQQGIAAHASVALMERGQLHQLLSSPPNRSRLIEQLSDLAVRDKYDGINIDFEFIAPEDGPYFTRFLQELKSALGPDKMLSVAVFARTGEEKWATPYDYKAIGETADLVVVMAYDYCYLDSEPGPVAPLWWVEKVAGYMQSQMAPEKILMGMATYGYDWGSDGEAKTVSASKLQQIMGKYTVVDHFDQASMSPYYTYYDEDGHAHQIWMENKQSLKAKWTMFQAEQLGGTAFWRIGTGFLEIYQVLAGL
ncbi:MAG: glycosyl hydrolase family 18 protein [Syntrophomonadaceae bacterium]